MKNEMSLAGSKRTLFLTFLSLVTSLAFVACNNSTPKVQNELDDLNAYIQHHKDSVEQYAKLDWGKLDSGYVAQKEKVERDTASMSAEMKASYYSAVRNWEGFQNDYSIKRAEESKINEMDLIRKALTLDGVRPDFTDLKATNILNQYEHFVSVVKTNKDTYTKEQWTVVNVSWKALNGRRRELDKDINAVNGGKITKLQLEYTGVKALNRPSAENS